MGWVLGFIIYKVAEWIKNKILKVFFRMERMTVVDEYFL